MKKHYMTNKYLGKSSKIPNKKKTYYSTKMKKFITIGENNKENISPTKLIKKVSDKLEQKVTDIIKSKELTKEIESRKDEFTDEELFEAISGSIPRIILNNKKPSNIVNHSSVIKEQQSKTENKQQTSEVPENVAINVYCGEKFGRKILSTIVIDKKVFDTIYNIEEVVKEIQDDIMMKVMNSKLPPINYFTEIDNNPSHLMEMQKTVIEVLKPYITKSLLHEVQDLCCWKLQSLPIVTEAVETIDITVNISNKVTFKRNIKQIDNNLTQITSISSAFGLRLIS